MNGFTIVILFHRTEVKFISKIFFSKCDQIQKKKKKCTREYGFGHILKKSLLMENLKTSFFVQCDVNVCFVQFH